MADFITTANMNLTVPITGVTIGPEWANDVNASFVTVDAHDHSQGKGVQVTPAGLNINADLPLNGNNLTLVRTVRLQAPSIQPAGAADLTCLYALGADLYYRDGAGNQVRITQSGSVTGATGNITNLTSPASVTFVGGTSTFVFQSDANTPALLDGASVILRNLSANSKGLTLAPPAAMAADYTITLPSLPASQAVVGIDSSGAESSLLPNSTISLSGNVISVAPGGITQSQIVPGFGLMPTGGLVPFAGSALPSGFLLCDGASYLRSDLPGLFAAIGTSFGSRDGTQFSVPDMRGIFPRGAVASALNAIAGSGSASSNNATFTAHGLNRTGILVRVASGALTGLSTATTYYAVMVDANTLGFSTSLANALAGTLITISGSNTAVLTQWEDPDAAARAATTVGGATGAAVGSQQQDQVGPLTLSMSGGAVGGGTTGNPQNVVQSDTFGLTMTTNSSGTTETRPKNLYLNYLIKT